MVYNVRAYGAIGDGWANDTVALQTTIDAAWATQGRVFLPAGAYRISASLTVPGNGYDSSGFSMVGTGPFGSRIIGPNGGSDLAQLLLVGSTNFAGGIVLRDFSLEGGTGHTTGHGLILRCHNSLIENIRVVNAPQDGIRLENISGVSNQYQHLTNCISFNAGRDALFIDSTVTDLTIDRFLGPFFTRRGIFNKGGNVKFINCHTHPNVTPPPSDTASFYQEGGSLTQIIGGQYESGNINIHLIGTYECLILGANIYHFEGSPAAGIRIVSSQQMKVIGCQTRTVSGTPQIGILCIDSDGCIIADNTLANYGSGIWVSGGTSKFVIAGNSIPNSSLHAISVFEGSHGSIHDNVIDTAGITETAPSNYNQFHDNQLNGAALTVVGPNSVQHNNIP